MKKSEFNLFIDWVVEGDKNSDSLFPKGLEPKKIPQEVTVKDKLLHDGLMKVLEEQTKIYDSKRHGVSFNMLTFK